MKFAAYTEDTIWAIGATAEEARSEGEATIEECGETVAPDSLKVAPIDEGLIEAIEEAEATGEGVLFDLVDGELCEVEAED